MKLGPFLGMNNLLATHALEKVEGRARAHYLSNAIDVDIDTTGRLTAREGVTMHTPLTDAHSLYCDCLLYTSRCV